MENTEQQLAAAMECSDGWMSAYYRQTSRLLRAESALRDIVVFIKNPRKDLEKMAREALEEIKE
jgi:hypothetical protein